VRFTVPVTQQGSGGAETGGSVKALETRESLEALEARKALESLEALAALEGFSALGLAGDREVAGAPERRAR
jgi:hypothetical protein